jgi:hypothetical protein
MDLSFFTTPTGIAVIAAGGSFVGLVTAKVCEMAKCTISFGDARRLVLATSM